jgi:uncharacterized membrane protein YjjP (DUF1212 family)
VKNLERLRAIDRIISDVVAGTIYLDAQLKEDSKILYPARSYLKEVYYKTTP